jgi:dTMP kinase
MPNLIIVEGLDGVGKTTQVDLMIKFLENKKLKVRYFHFPYFDNDNNEYWGYIIKRYLFEKNTYLNRLSCVDKNIELAKLYGLNRLTRKQQILDSLNNNDIVICDRYTYSTLAFQVANLRICMQKEKYSNIEIGATIDRLKRNINELEWNKISGMPIPNLVFYLDGDVNIIKKYLNKRKGVKDLHEKDIQLQNYVRHEYTDLFTNVYNRNTYIIKCTNYNKLYPKEKINNEINKILIDIIY